MEAGNKQRRPVRVTICNQSFTLTTTGEDQEVVDLANRVDELISGIAARSSNSDPARLAILACLHLADRNLTVERELKAIEDLRTLFRDRAKQMESLLDQAIG